jgi:hypothetical protein
LGARRLFIRATTIGKRHNVAAGYFLPIHFVSRTVAISKDAIPSA